MRIDLVAAIVLTLSAAAAAQSPELSSAPAAAGTFAPLPPIGLPLPQIGLPLPAIGLPRIDAHVGQPLGRSSAGRPHRSTRHYAHRQPPLVYVFPLYPLSVVHGGHQSHAHDSDDAPRDRQKQPRYGTVRLDVAPAELLEVYVDGFYAGLPDDFDRELELDAGPHRIELRAPGHESLAIDVNVVADRSTTLRRTLAAVPADAGAGTAPTAPTPGTPMTVYMIPGCYLGNVPPAEAKLPASCDPGRVVTYRR